jgi:hypothetical protein
MHKSINKRSIFSAMSGLVIVVASIGISVALSGCGAGPVPQDVVDNSMSVSRHNAQKNANSYLPIAYPEGKVDAQTGSKPIRILMQSDSTIGPNCRYGDGWASGDIQFENGKTIPVKCQTNGTGKGINGCMTKSEFEKKPYKDEEGRCANLEKLDKFN